MKTTIYKLNLTTTMNYDEKLIAKCGLYCGACKSYIKGKCPGCAQNEKASWCGVRKCCNENSYRSCADCQKIELMDCKKYNNFMSKLFAFLFKSNRPACIAAIKESGYTAFAKKMAESGMQTIKK